MFACLHAPGNLPLAVECARGFSPHIEENPPDTVIFDVRGLESLYGPPERLAHEIERRIGVPSSLAIAANPIAIATHMIVLLRITAPLENVAFDRGDERQPVCQAGHVARWYGSATMKVDPPPSRA